jgi:hypothetical protein
MAQTITIISKCTTFLKKEPIETFDLPSDKKVKIYRNRAYKCKVLASKDEYTHVDLGSLGEWWIKDKNWQGLDERPLTIDKQVITTEVGKLHLHVPYFKQKSIHEGGYRTSLYLCCASVAMFLKPGKIAHPDEYYEGVQKFGGHESPHANIDFLRSLNIQATYRKDGNLSYVKRAIDMSVPLICCVLNEGDGYNVHGEGHWITVVGYDENKKRYIANDPLGKFSYLRGTYEDPNGEAVHYPRNFFRNRWNFEDYNSGWWICFER